MFWVVGEAEVGRGRLRSPRRVRRKPEVLAGVEAAAVAAAAVALALALGRTGASLLPRQT